jgi:SAM-dependent methyltransferase
MQSIRDRNLAIPERWRRRRADEISYWADTLRSPEVGRLFPDRLDPKSEIRVPGLVRALAEIPETDVSILDVGSGPLTSVGKTFPGKKITVVATDPLAAEYVAILRECRICAPVLPVACAGEELLKQFRPETFDIALASNSLDHSADPLAVLENMLALIKPAGRVALMHFRNVGERHGYAGLHFWNIDYDGNRLIFWNRAVRHDLTAHLSDRFEIECWTTDDGDRLHCLIRPRHRDLAATTARRTVVDQKAVEDFRVRDPVVQQGRENAND